MTRLLPRTGGEASGGGVTTVSRRISFRRAFCQRNAWAIADDDALFFRSEDRKKAVGVDFNTMEVGNHRVQVARAVYPWGLNGFQSADNSSGWLDDIWRPEPLRNGAVALTIADTGSFGGRKARKGTSGYGQSAVLGVQGPSSSRAISARRARTRAISEVAHALISHIHLLSQGPLRQGLVS